MAIHELDRIKVKEILPGFLGKFIHTEKLTIAFWEIQQESILPLHSHPHEQVTIVQGGELELTIDEETRILKKGQVATLPSNSLHSGRAVTDCQVLDIFTPVREDYR